MGAKEEIKEAIEQLRKFEINKITLKRDVFFVPGWSSENCAAWLDPYTDRNTSMKQWLDRITTNWQAKAHFVSFTEEESKQSRSFMDFGKILIGKINSYVQDTKTRVDLIGHSMGGLDISSAVVFNALPSERVKNVMTLGSPFHGAEWGKMMKDFRRASFLFLGGWTLMKVLLSTRYSQYHILQLENMNPDGKLIKEFNTRENRIKLLNSVDKVYTFYGTDDDTVKESALFNGFGISQDMLDQKLRAVCIEGATHSGELGLPQDPRVICEIMKILSA